MIRVGVFGPWYGSRVHPNLTFWYGAEIDAAVRSGEYELVAGWTDQLGIDETRNGAIEWARKKELDYLLMVDADVCPGIISIPAFIGTARDRGASVVAAAVPLRREKPTINVYPHKPNQVYEAELCGSGLIFISIAEMNRIAERYSGPWFCREYTDPRHSEVGVTGDVFFSKLIRDHGGRLFVDSRIPVAHICSVPFEYIPEAAGDGSGDQIIAADQLAGKAE